MKQISFLLLIFPQIAFGALNKTYPTSAVTNLRIETYVDAFSTIYNSTYSIGVSTWVILNSKYIYFTPSKINGFEYSLINSSWTKTNIEFELKDILDMVVNQSKIEFINNVLDSDIEQYLVWPSTSAPKDWDGWCMEKINGKDIPISCR